MHDKINFQIYDFFLDCKDRYYGYTVNCADKCGHCKDNNICNKDAGYCSGGCESNFMEFLCQGN